jgi:hypothetical protein
MHSIEVWVNLNEQSWYMLKFTDEVVAQLRVWRNLPAGPPNKFIILFYGRSGSGLLRTLLNCHPDVYCDAEIYLHRKALFPKRYLQNRAKLYGKKYYGHKAKLFQLEEQYSDVDKIRDTYLTGNKIIFLKRDSFVRQAISVFIGVQRGKWHDKRENSLAGQKFKINPVKLLEKVRRIDTYYNKKEKLLRGIDHLYINYERDLLSQENHQGTMDKVFDYLGLYSVPVYTNYVKTSPENLEEVLDNYDEVIEAIRNSEFAHFLEDLTGTA